MQNPNVFIELYPGMGRGMATFGGLQKGAFIMQCELLVLNSLDTIYLGDSELQFYTFKYNHKQDCIVLGNGELFNHSDTPNVSYELRPFEQDGQTRKVMMFTALRDIEPGEQLFIDYAQDTKVDTDKYVTSKSLIGG